MRAVKDIIRNSAEPPEWLLKAWADAKRRGLDVLTPEEINAEIAAVRAAKSSRRDEGE